MVILDVRHPLELHGDPLIIPGTVYFPLERWKEEDDTLFRDKEVIVYCN